MTDLFKAFALTCVIEGIIALIICRKWIVLRDNFICNIVTNPILNLMLFLIYNMFGITWYYICVAAGELIVVFIEFLIYGILGKNSAKKRFTLSLATNAGSFCIGILINFILRGI